MANRPANLQQQMLCFAHQGPQASILFTIVTKMCKSQACVLNVYLFKTISRTLKHLWNYLWHTKEIVDMSLPQRSTGGLATLALLNKPWLFEERSFEQTTKQCVLKYLQIWHLFNSAWSTLQLHKRHLGGSEMQTGPHTSLCVKATKWARVVFCLWVIIRNPCAGSLRLGK